ncbi:hypothetical protein D3C78_1573760 [compost metagenome]
MLNLLLGISGLSLILPAFFVLVSSVGLVGPNATAMAMTDQGRCTGLASALHVSMIHGMGMFAGLLVSYLHDGSLWPLAGVVFAFNIAGLLVYRFLRRAPADTQVETALG